MSPEGIYNYPENADMAKRCKESIQEWERELPASKASGGKRPDYYPVDQPIGLELAVTWLAEVRTALKAASKSPDSNFTDLEAWVRAARSALKEHQPVPAHPEFETVGKWLLATALPDNLKRIPILPHPADRHGVGGHGWFRWQTLYDGMIHPLIPCSMKGMVWYQGENGSGKSYYGRFRSMVETMRKERGNAFPAYIVQLPNFDKATDDRQGEPDKWPATREQQLKCLQIPNVGLAVTIDVGDPTDLHPANKGDMGERLALWSLAKDYGKKIVYSGPLYKGMEIRNGKVILSFESIGTGLMAGKKEARSPAVEDTGAKLKRFAIAGEDKKWVWAEAVIDGATVIISSAEVTKPVAVRYAYSMNPEGGNLYNKEGLPASPFRTDDW